MFEKVLSSVLVLTSGAFAQTDGVKYNQAYRNWGAVDPTEISPTSSSIKRFGEVVAIWNGIVAVSSKEVIFDYDDTGAVGTRGRVSVYGSDYLRRFSDSGVNFISPRVNDGYGTSLSLWEGTMLVGAPYCDSEHENGGAAYVYFGGNFGSVQALTADHGEAGDYFGYSVAVAHGRSYYDDGMAIVGAYGHDHDKESTSGQGCVFVYTRDSSYLWKLVGKLEPQDFEHKDHGGFGYALSAYGNTIAVGTYSAEKAFVFELAGHLHECPHGQEGKPEDMPDECQDGRRHLRSLQGHPEEDRDKKWYTEWKYDHILTVGLEEEHKPEKEKEVQSYSFGQTVALYNESGILTLAVGAPDSVDENVGEQVGKVYVMSMMQRGDVQEGWYPEGYDHHDEDKQREEEAREQERQEREENDRNKRMLQKEDDKNRFRTWNPMTHDFCGDKMGNFWMLETVFSGTTANERLGHSVALHGRHLLIGNNPSTFNVGRADMYWRTSGSGVENSPLVSGPLSNTGWIEVGDMSDSMGSTGDHFGYSVAIGGIYSTVADTAVVGAIMSGIQSDGTYGQGMVYIYDRNYVDVPTPFPSLAPTPRVFSPVAAPVAAAPDAQEESLTESITDSHSPIGIVFYSSVGIIGCTVLLLGAFTIYRTSGGEKSPHELVFGKPVRSQIRLATMDDSGFSTSTDASHRGLKSAYTGLDTSSAHGINRLPVRPSPVSAPQRGASAAGGGATRTFTPKAQRSFTPKSKIKSDNIEL